jgi:hypothetical protein
MPYDPRRTYEFRCPVHGFIKLNDWERAIVDTPIFQRLRRIRQLAWTEYVYPGATHTRFEHSLGVMHTATRVYDAVCERSQPILESELAYNDDGLRRDKQLVRLAALLHDVGHTPFSHAAEDLFPEKARGKRYAHEDYSTAIIRTRLKDVIENHPRNANYGFRADDVAAMDQELANRLAVLTRLVKESPSRSLGRTAIMKLTYFLTILRDVPLEYRFTLYSYGPFDSTVLQDVDFASTLGALRSRPVRYATGLGYSIEPTDNSDDVEALATEFLEEHQEDIDWVIREFGNFKAADLELASTTIYIDHEVTGPAIPATELARRVHDVKPHFSNERILGWIHTLKTKNLLDSCL